MLIDFQEYQNIFLLDCESIKCQFFESACGMLPRKQNGQPFDSMTKTT